MRFKLFPAILIFSMASSAHAGAWLQPKGQGLFFNQATFYTTNHYFDTDGQLQPQSRFSKYEYQPYAEYGLLDSLTLGGSAYIQRDTQSGGSNVGIADPEMFLRTLVYSTEHQQFSLQPLIKFKSQFQSGNPPRGGSSSTDVELSALYGRNLNLLSDRDFLDIRIGYRKRGASLSDQWKADAALGLQLDQHWQIIPAISLTAATAIADSATFTENGDMDYDLLKASIAAAYHFSPQRWVQAAAFVHALGVQTGGGYGASLGFAQRF